MSDKRLENEELRWMLKSTRHDIAALEAELTELRETERWLLRQLPSYNSVSIEQLRDFLYMQTIPLPVTRIANELGCSEAQIRQKLKPLILNGTVIRIIPDIGVHAYAIYRGDHPELKPKQKPTPKVNPSSTRAVTGTGNRKRRARNAEVRKGRRGHS